MIPEASNLLAQPPVSNSSTLLDSVKTISDGSIVPNPATKNLSVDASGNATTGSVNVTESSTMAANSTGRNAMDRVANSTDVAINATKILGPNNAAEPSTTVKATSAATKQPDQSGPEISHKKFFRPMSDTSSSSRNERKFKEKKEAAREQEERRLGDYSSSMEERMPPDFGGPLDVRTMGGNQLDIDPVNLDDDGPSASVQQMDQRSSVLSSSPLCSPAALTSLLLTALLAAYVRL
uniref:Uncharacterized protein n=1 Tax=Lygus hesperus TaxID=30085 RepID=A0A0K8SW87_LYGHE